MTGQGTIGNNMFAYCLNDSVNRYDTDGMDSHHNAAEPWDCICAQCIYKPSIVGAASDIYLSIRTASSVITGTYPIAGIVNNGINYIYYTWISSGESDLEQSNYLSSYTSSYVTRWDRLDFVKQQTGSSEFGFNAWRFNGEYSMHMYGWYAIKPFFGFDNEIINKYKKSAEQAHIATHSEDTNVKTRLLTYLFGILGL